MNLRYSCVLQELEVICYWNLLLRCMYGMLMLMRLYSILLCSDLHAGYLITIVVMSVLCNTDIRYNHYLVDVSL